MSTSIEHEIQRQMLERLGIAWTPGEPFEALVEDEINRLRATQQHCHCDEDMIRFRDEEIERLRAALEASHQHPREYPKPGCAACELLGSDKNY